MDDINDSGYCEPRPLDAMNNLELRMIQTVLGRESMSLNIMINSRLWVT